jgi:hypothetical protein
MKVIFFKQLIFLFSLAIGKAMCASNFGMHMVVAGWCGLYYTIIGVGSIQFI